MTWIPEYQIKEPIKLHESFWKFYGLVEYVHQPPKIPRTINGLSIGFASFKSVYTWKAVVKLIFLATYKLITLFFFAFCLSTMNAEHLFSRIYATEEKPFIPGYNSKSLVMGKCINMNQLKTKSPADIAQCIHILSQGCQNIICYNGKGPPLFLSQISAIR